VLILAGLSMIPFSAAVPPAAYTVLFVPGPAEDAGRQSALVSPELLTRLEELSRRGAPPARGAVLLGARYEGKGDGAGADFKAEFQVYSFAAQATLTVPLGGVVLKEGSLLDGADAYPVALPAPQAGYALEVSGRGPHTVSLRFNVRVPAAASNYRE